MISSLHFWRSQPSKFSSKIIAPSKFGMFGMQYDDDTDLPMVYVDGVCLNGGKPEAKAGVGVYFEELSNYNIASPLEGGSPSCQEAELQAAALGLEQAARIGLHRVVVATDSRYVIDTATSKLPQYKKNDWKTLNDERPPHYRTLKRLDKAIDRMMMVNWKLLEPSTSTSKNHMGHAAAQEMAFNGARSYQPKIKPAQPSREVA